MTHGYRPPLCDCPSDASLARIDRLVVRLDQLCFVTLFLPFRPAKKLEPLLERAADMQYEAHVRRCGCLWHNEALRQLYFQGDFQDEPPTR